MYSDEKIESVIRANKKTPKKQNSKLYASKKHSVSQSFEITGTFSETSSHLNMSIQESELFEPEIVNSQMDNFQQSAQTTKCLLVESSPDTPIVSTYN